MAQHGSAMRMDGDVGSVVNSVAGVISAFESGASILQRIRKKREAAGAPPLPSFLEESIVQAPEEIEKEKLRGIRRFGKEFEMGDFPAIMALQQITIHLQNSLLQKINTVDDVETDLAALAYAADLGRDNTMTTLINLRQRLGRTEISNSSSSVTGSIPIGPAAPTAPVESKWPTTFSPVSPRTETPPHTYREREASNDQVEIRSTTSSRSEAKDSGCPKHWSIASSTGPPSIPKPASAGPNNTNNNFFTSPHNSPHTHLLPQPSSSNNYLGFCKSAWKLQNGDAKALTKSKDYAHSAQSHYHYYSCSKFRCEFRGHGPEVLDNRPVWDDVRGMQYRWTFFAKSHVMVKKSPATYAYLCMFCVFLGRAPPVVNVSALLEHISREHRGAGLGEAVLDRTKCVDGRVCRGGEEFDINLFPVEGQEEEEVGREKKKKRGEVAGSLAPPVELADVKGEKVFELYA